MTDPATWRDAKPLVSNWGRWGEEDELGTLNLVGPPQIRNATKSVRHGSTISLSLPFDAYGIQSRSGLRRNLTHLMVVDGGDAVAGDWLAQGGRTERQVSQMFEGDIRFTEDVVFMDLQVGTQWDGLCHVHYDGQVYNGHDAVSITSFGATKAGIEHQARHSVVTRAVLLDIARYLDLPALEPRFEVTPELLDHVADSQATTVEAGDVVVVRTGWLERLRRDRNYSEFKSAAAGLTWRAAVWAHERDVAAIAADNMSVEVETSEGFPLHMLALRDMGMMLGELWDLERLATHCSAERKFDFMLSASPLEFTGAVGSPVNPIAIL